MCGEGGGISDMSGNFGYHTLVSTGASVLYGTAN